MTKIWNWLIVKHPDLACKIQRWSTDFEEWSWRRYLKHHRCCCEDTLIEHCANKLAVNSKKACCYAYLPYYCTRCGRRIPKRIRYRYMMFSSLIEQYEEQKRLAKKPSK